MSAPPSAAKASSEVAAVDGACYSAPGAPSVTSDPRFRAGRKLVMAGKADRGAVGFFATLVEESRRKYGDSSVEAAPCYYEYGNALFRAAVKRKEEPPEEDEDDDENDAATADEDAKPAAERTPKKKKAGESSSSSSPSAARSAAAEAAERRLAAAAAAAEPRSEGNGEKGGNAKVEVEPGENGSGGRAEAAGPKEDASRKGGEAKSDSGSEDADDARLALELMENAWSILDQHVVESSSSSRQCPRAEWARSQLPRVLTGIGDVLSDLGRHGDAVDAYTRALAHRERAVEDLTKKKSSDGGGGDGGLELLAARRRLVEANILIAEELLACPAGRDVVTTETGDVLVRAAERVEYARGYYDRARDGLQEAVFLMGKLAAGGTALGSEKEDVCYLATMVMGVGTALAQIDEEGEEGRGAKKRKTG